MELGAGLRELVDSSPNAVAVFDRELRYARVNAKLAELFACTPGDLQGQRTDVLAADDVTAPFLDDLATGEAITHKRFVCDLMMPEISGFELYKRVSDELPALAERFLFMTGGTFTADAQAFVDSLAAPYLEKPFAPAQLRTLVRERVST